MFMVVAMFYVEAKNRACSNYYKENLQFYHVSENFLFQVQNKTLDALGCCVLYELALRIAANPLLTAIALKRCIKA